MNADSRRELDMIVQKISETVDAEEIYLFGSFAENKEQPDSDFDIYVVLKAHEIRPLKAMQKINIALAPLPIRSVDILAGYHETMATSPFIEKTVLERGVKLYERKEDSGTTLV